MTFEDFAKLHGVLIGRLIDGRWVRVPTVDKPKSRNGAYKFMGDHGFVQNWATMLEPSLWQAEGDARAAAQRTSQVAEQAAREIAQNARKAARKAEAILAECELAIHPYLATKGFPDAMVNVWKRESDNVMVIPMRSDGQIVGCQLIKPSGEKKFLFGQRSGGAEFVIGQRGTHVLCEGYATALSAQQALRHLKTQYTLHVCFSASNVKRATERLPVGLVIADNDTPSKQAPDPGGMGKKVADESGWPYWISDREGEDANDYALRAGGFALAMGIKKILMETRRRA